MFKIDPHATPPGPYLHVGVEGEGGHLADIAPVEVLHDGGVDVVHVVELVVLVGELGRAADQVTFHLQKRGIIK